MSTNQSQKLNLKKEEEFFLLTRTIQEEQTYVEILERFREKEMAAAEKGTSIDLYGVGDLDGTCDGNLDPIWGICCRVMAEMVSKHVTEKKAYIIDIGAGSGTLGKELKKLGFVNIDGLEPSNDIVNQDEGIYNQMFQEMITDVKPTSILNDTYDNVVANGAMLTGHVDVEGIPELLRILKPGGKIIFNVSDPWSKYKGFGRRLDFMLQEILEKGHVDYVMKERMAYIYNYEDATVYILKKSHNRNM